MTETLTKQEAGGALAYGGGESQFDASDLRLRRLKLGQYMSDHVKYGRVPYGCVFLETGTDDPEPVVVSDPGKGLGDYSAPPVRFYVVAYIKGWSHARKGERLRTWRFDDPSRHPDAWKTHRYGIVLPEVDEDFPATMLLTRTSTPAARSINTALIKAATRGKPAHSVPFELVAQKSKNDQGDYAVAIATVADPPQAVLDSDKSIVEAQFELAQSGIQRDQRAATESTVDEDAPAANRPSIA